MSQPVAEADTAAGEIIYSSDGVEAPPLKPPPVHPTIDNGEDRLDDTAVDAAIALQTFLRSSSTPSERLQHIHRELETLSKEASSDAALAQEVAALQAKLQRQQIAPVKNEPPVVTSDLEALLLRLEKAVGSISGPPATNRKTMLERLSLLEWSLSSLDETRIEAASRKAKLIRQDLEAASKARSKLMSGSARAEDTKTLTTLYDKLLELSDLTEHLPDLAERLQSLAHQHQESSTWALRLSALEATATRLAAQVSSAESAVEELTASWPTQAQLMKGNLAALDERISKLK